MNLLLCPSSPKTMTDNITGNSENYFLSSGSALAWSCLVLDPRGPFHCLSVHACSVGTHIQASFSCVWACAVNGKRRRKVSSFRSVSLSATCFHCVLAPLLCAGVHLGITPPSDSNMPKCLVISLSSWLHHTQVQLCSSLIYEQDFYTLNAMSTVQGVTEIKVSAWSILFNPQPSIKL